MEWIINTIVYFIYDDLQDIWPIPWVRYWVHVSLATTSLTKITKFITWNSRKKILRVWRNDWGLEVIISMSKLQRSFKYRCQYLWAVTYSKKILSIYLISLSFEFYSRIRFTTASGSTRHAAWYQANRISQRVPCFFGPSNKVS